MLAYEILTFKSISLFIANHLDNNACQNSPCLNGGTCQVTGSGTTYVCTCRSSYSGTNCQICNNNILKL